MDRKNNNNGRNCSYCTAVLHLCFRMCKNLWFSHDVVHIVLVICHFSKVAILPCVVCVVGFFSVRPW